MADRRLGGVAPATSARLGAIVPGAPDDPSDRGSWQEVLAVFTRLGLTSFGGPVAHLGYFHAELVARRRWLSEQAYADLVALCQFLPGPASSQVGIGIGLTRAGLLGGFAAWVGFTLPSALLLVAFAFGVDTLTGVAEADWLRGLKIVAVAVVAHAVRGMATTLTPDRARLTIAVAAAIVVLVFPTNLVQVMVIAAGALVGWRLLPAATSGDDAAEGAASGERAPLPRRVGIVLLGIFALGLVVLPALRAATEVQAVAVADAFYRAGSLVFGGGHVVLPLLRAEVVPPGWVDETSFIAGYGAAQAVPGPLFTFAAYLGASMAPGSGAVGLALVALVAVFVPSFLLLLGVLPYWQRLRGQRSVRAALRGVNAVVVGILLAALYEPVWTSAIATATDVALALAAFMALAVWRWPAWLVVLLTGAVGAAAVLIA